MNKTNVSMIALIALTAWGCSNLRPFTDQLYEDNQWSLSELQKIQFYLSNDIVLTRALEGQSAEIVNGEIKVIDGRKVEQITIRKGTPGIVLFKPKDDRLAIGFEDGNDTRYLIFGPSPRANDRYVLMASEWNRNFGKVTYEGKKYQVDASSAYASILVDLKRINRSSVNSRTARGRKVGGN
ncbi:MAG TPA: hypothetical protein PKA00_08735 [Saprospiraceae bacterium]|nr:hypothetical protein [Saprospiraceae bacterium]HMQ82980.1 hypothetical protein [Saprospiraceae bacterium]